MDWQLLWLVQRLDKSLNSNGDYASGSGIKIIWINKVLFFITKLFLLLKCPSCYTILVVRVLGYRSRCPGSIPGATTFPQK
jgi:hypothetical protein